MGVNVPNQTSSLGRGIYVQSTLLWCDASSNNSFFIGNITNTYVQCTVINVAEPLQPDI